MAWTVYRSPHLTRNSYFMWVGLSSCITVGPSIVIDEIKDSRFHVPSKSTFPVQVHVINSVGRMLTAQDLSRQHGEQSLLD